MPKTAPLIRRFLDKVAMPIGHAAADGCFEWTGGRDIGGYGKFMVARGFNEPAHRVAYEMAYDTIPAGKIVLHTCDNRGCVRASHLKVGTNADNVRDMFAKGRARPGGTNKTHCKRGHPFDAANTYRTPDGKRICRTCERAKRKRLNALWKQGKRGSGRLGDATHCSRGHEFTPENTSILSRGQRCCKQCKRMGIRTQHTFRQAKGLTRATKPQKGSRPTYEWDKKDQGPV